MKQLLFVGLLCLIFACKKSDDNGPNLALDHFTIGGTEYTATEYDPQNIYWGTNNGHGSGIWFYFLNALHPSGIYRIANDTGLDAVSFRARLRNGVTDADFLSTGNGHLTLTVSYSHGNMIITMPQTWAKGAMNGSTDSLLVSAYLKEYL